MPVVAYWIACKEQVKWIHYVPWTHDAAPPFMPSANVAAHLLGWATRPNSFLLSGQKQKTGEQGWLTSCHINDTGRVKLGLEGTEPACFTPKNTDFRYLYICIMCLKNHCLFNSSQLKSDFSIPPQSLHQAIIQWSSLPSCVRILSLACWCVEFLFLYTLPCLPPPLARCRVAWYTVAWRHCFLPTATTRNRSHCLCGTAYTWGHELEQTVVCAGHRHWSRVRAKYSHSSN